MKALLAVLLLAGCHQWTIHGSRNALGVGPVERAPHQAVNGVEPEDGAAIAVGEVVEPEDPGEYAVSFGLGPWAAVGLDDHGNGHGIFGVEAEILVADSDFSHVADMFMDLGLIQGTGFDVGFSYYESEARLGPIYIEALTPQDPTVVRFGFGMAYDPGNEQFGPQMSVSLLGLFIRGQALFGEDHRGLLMLGFVLEPPVTYTRSH